MTHTVNEKLPEREARWDYSFWIGPGTTEGAWLDVLGCVDGDGDLYIRSAHCGYTTPHQFQGLVRRLRKAGLEVSEMTRELCKSPRDTETVYVDGHDDLHRPEEDPTA